MPGSSRSSTLPYSTERVLFEGFDNNRRLYEELNEAEHQSTAYSIS